MILQTPRKNNHKLPSRTDLPGNKFVPTSNELDSNSNIARLLKYTVKNLVVILSLTAYATDGRNRIMMSLVLAFSINQQSRTFPDSSSSNFHRQ